MGYNGGKAMKVLKNVLLYGTLTDVTVESGKIASIEKTDLDGEDMGGLKIYPGLIDIHSHGALGHDTMDADGSLHEMAVYFKENGITTWFPTTMTMSRDDIYARRILRTERASPASIWRAPSSTLSTRSLRIPTIFSVPIWNFSTTATITVK